MRTPHRCLSLALPLALLAATLSPMSAAAETAPWQTELASALEPAHGGMVFSPPLRAGDDEAASDVVVLATVEQNVSTDTVAEASAASEPRSLLMALADKLRNIRYRRGGSDPATGFDCSGFVRYVFRHGVGVDLPANSASQFRTGQSVDRHAMRSGDLVFFRTAGKRISHVGIYVDNGRFIHSPSTGKVVRVDRLDQGYWARHFAGARRPEAFNAS